MTIFMLSLAGFPPLAGFIGKVYLFMPAIKTGTYWLVTLAFINSVVSFVYYGGVIKRMFLEEGTRKDPIVLPRLAQAVLAILVIGVIVMGLWWSPFDQFSRDSASMLTQSAPVAQK